MAGTYDASKGNPNRIGTFSLVRNKEKEAEKHPDMVHPDSVDENGIPKLNKAGKPFKKNFTIKMNGVEVWCEAYAYFQKDKSIKISINKTSSGLAAAPGAATSAAPSGDSWDNQF